MSPSPTPRLRAAGAACLALLLPLVLRAEAGDPPAEPVNLGFEEGTQESGLPAGWLADHYGYEVAVTPDAAHGGDASLRIAASHDELTDQAFASLIQRIPAASWKGRRVRLSGWLRTRDVESGWAGLWMRVDAAIGPPLAFDNMRGRGPRGTTAWTRYEVVLDVPPEASEIFFGAVLAGNGTAWADDLALEEVPDSVETTAEPRAGE